MNKIGVFYGSTTGTTEDLYGNVNSTHIGGTKMMNGKVN